MKTIGERIQEERLKHNMTQLDLAKLLHVTRQAISSYENNKTTPDIDTLKQLNTIFNIDLFHDTTPTPTLKNYSTFLYLGLIAIVMIDLIVRYFLHLPLLKDNLLLFVMILIATTIYFTFNYAIKNEDYTMIAGYDSSLPYHYPTLKKMMLLILHTLLSSVIVFTLLFIVGMYTHVYSLYFPILFIVFLMEFTGSILLINYRYQDQLFLKKTHQNNNLIPVIIFLISIFLFVFMIIYVMEYYHIENNSNEAVQLLMIIFPYLIYNVTWLLVVSNKMKKDEHYHYFKSVIITIVINFILLCILYFIPLNF